MVGLMASEQLKLRHTFGAKLVVVAPVILTAGLAALLGLGGPYGQAMAYNWWVTLMLPIVLPLWAAQTVASEKRCGWQNVLAQPLDLRRLWWAKAAVVAGYLALSSLILWLVASFMGGEVSWGSGFAGTVVLVASLLWQIPADMWLARHLGTVATVLLSYVVNFMTMVVAAEKTWFLLVPTAIPGRIVCPFFKVHINGVPLEAGSPLLGTGDVLPALLVSAALFVVVMALTTKVFVRWGGGRHG